MGPKATTPVVYTDEWAYVPVGPQGERQLFGLCSDPYAERNMIAGHSDDADRLHAKLLEWLRKVEAPTETIHLFE